MILRGLGLGLELDKTDNSIQIPVSVFIITYNKQVYKSNTRDKWFKVSNFLRKKTQPAKKREAI